MGAVDEGGFSVRSGTRHRRTTLGSALHQGHELTFWPDYLGKKSEAISHFQILIDQQESVPAEANHAQTHLFLGNLLENKDAQKAKAMWQRGLARHPNNEELRRRLGQ